MKSTFCLFCAVLALAWGSAAQAQGSPAPGTPAIGAVAPSAAPSPDADLLAKKPAHERELEKIEADRLVFSRDLARREEECLKLFLSSGCLEDIRREHLREMRQFDLRRETERQALRDIDAEIRTRDRARRIADRDARQKTPTEPSPSQKGAS